jgi:hypothetical protein
MFLEPEFSSSPVESTQALCTNPTMSGHTERYSTPNHLPSGNAPKLHRSMRDRISSTIAAASTASRRTLCEGRLSSVLILQADPHLDDTPVQTERNEE